MKSSKKQANKISGRAREQRFLEQPQTRNDLIS